MSKIQHNPDDRRRVISLRGVWNCRDLGGYGTQEGKQIKWGVLYRSGNLSKLHRMERDRFKELDIHTLIDFRSIVEQEQEPNRLPRDNKIETMSLPVLDQGNKLVVKEIYRMIRENDWSDFDPEAEMVQAYKQFAIEFSDQYRQFIHTIIKANGKPVLWHCTAGKDRAGFAAAILLRLLGVAHPVVVEDYMLSAKYVDSKPKLRFLLRLFNRAQAAHMLEALLKVHEHWIQTAFQALDDHWGNFERYTNRALGLSPADISELRQSLLDTSVISRMTGNVWMTY